MTTILQNTGMSMAEAERLPHPQFYALASRLIRGENAQTVRMMTAVKTAVESFWHGKKETIDRFLAAYPFSEKQDSAPPAAPNDRLSDGRQKSNLDGFKALQQKMKAKRN